MNRRHRIISADLLLDLSNGECEHLVARSTTDLRFTLQSSLQNLLKKRRTLKAGNGRDHWHMNKSLFKKSVHREQSGKERFIYFDRPAAQQKCRRWPYSVFSVEDLERHRRVIKFFSNSKVATGTCSAGDIVQTGITWSVFNWKSRTLTKSGATRWPRCCLHL